MEHLTIGPRVHELAERVAHDALETEDRVFRLDCFKALSQFFIGMTRASGKNVDYDDESVGISVPEMRARIRAVQE